MMTIAIGYSISWPAMLPASSSGTRASPVVSAVIMIGASRSFAPWMTRPGPKGTPSSCLQVLVVADEHDAVAGHDAEHREEADQRSERDDAAEPVDGDRAADERRRAG